jgi:hypothetical protein
VSARAGWCACGLLLTFVMGARADGAPEGEPADPRVDAEALRVDGIAAVVGGLAPGPGVLTIFESDVELRARVAVLRQSDLRGALSPLPAALLAASLKELLGEALIAFEATRLNMPEAGGAVLAEHRAQLIGTRHWPTPARALIEALGVNERELSEWVERRAQVDAFLQANLEGTLDTSEEELEKAFASEPHPFYGEPFELARPAFTQWLTQRKLAEAVERWIVSLSQRTPHRVLVAY